MLSLVVPLYYQLLQAYRPVSPNFNVSTVSVSNSPTPSLTPPVLGVSTSLPAIGGEGQVVTLALFGDSMIQTLNSQILVKSLQNYFPATKFNLLNYGYPATALDKAINNLDFVISQNPDIIVIESFAYNNFGNTTSGLEKQTQLLTATVNTINTKLPSAKIIISATIAPNSIIFGNGIPEFHFTALDKIERAKTIRLYLENAITFAQNRHLPLANAYSASLVNNEGFLSLIDTATHLHPSDYGQQFFSDTVAKTIFDNKLID